MKRILSIFTLLLMLCSLLALPAAAAPAEDLSLTLHCTWAGSGVAQMPFDVYYAAKPSGSGFALDGDFANYPVDLDDLGGTGNLNAATTLYSFAQRDGLRPLASGKTNGDGLLQLPLAGQSPLRPGLYLVSGPQMPTDEVPFSTQPFVVAVPGADPANPGQTSNHVIVAPKLLPDEEYSPVTALGVQKVWALADGAAAGHPDSVTVQLMKDGNVVPGADIVLNAENNWTHDWTGLDGNSVWTVAEKVPVGYHVIISPVSSGFVIKNTKQVPPPTPTNPPEDDEDKPAPTPAPTPSPSPMPQTGTLWWVVPILAALGLALLVWGIAWYRRSRDA